AELRVELAVRVLGRDAHAGLVVRLAGRGDPGGRRAVGVLVAGQARQLGGLGAELPLARLARGDPRVEPARRGIAAPHALSAAHALPAARARPIFPPRAHRGWSSRSTTGHQCADSTRPRFTARRPSHVGARSALIRAAAGARASRSAPVGARRAHDDVAIARAEEELGDLGAGAEQRRRFTAGLDKPDRSLLPGLGPRADDPRLHARESNDRARARQGFRPPSVAFARRRRRAAARDPLPTRAAAAPAPGGPPVANRALAARSPAIPAAGSGATAAASAGSARLTPEAPPGPAPVAPAHPDAPGPGRRRVVAAGQGSATRPTPRSRKLPR